MAKKSKQNDIIGEATAAALNDAFNFGIAHAEAMRAAHIAHAEEEKATASANALMHMIMVPSKKDLN